jgi:hypothetical protein
MDYFWVFELAVELAKQRSSGKEAKRKAEHIAKAAFYMDCEGSSVSAKT